ncbi:hypothetical protein FN846DRAFT_979742 [Sphaerosporella brunnea]|uniref:Uncharacterized protein n=1 Tax=Sphaerosporella brunnea TaxID=1250544 RepID=A0A5J5ECL4_9PEZI|nr:hypothetical protein FN846DRAFT_979721 [Sphaerosporella brunnea]KAA8893257.1 hypothetical protein FN846DRAFT_979742 [Sphaerosporella brunnea]
MSLYCYVASERSCRNRLHIAVAPYASKPYLNYRFLWLAMGGGSGFLCVHIRTISARGLYPQSHRPPFSFFVTRGAFFFFLNTYALFTAYKMLTRSSLLIVLGGAAALVAAQEPACVTACKSTYYDVTVAQAQSAACLNAAAGVTDVVEQLQQVASCVQSSQVFSDLDACISANVRPLPGSSQSKKNRLIDSMRCSATYNAEAQLAIHTYSSSLVSLVSEAVPLPSSSAAAAKRLVKRHNAVSAVEASATPSYEHVSASETAAATAAASTAGASDVARSNAGARSVVEGGGGAAVAVAAAALAALAAAVI